MLFNSVNFAIFLPIVFCIYWLADKNFRLQNLILLTASLFFYACWDWRFLFLLMFTIFLDYTTGLKISQSSGIRTRQTWLWVSIVVNVGFLGVFKYYDFFASSFASAFSRLGLSIHPATLKLILPIGISFYTFHGLSYVIDIYNRKIEPEKNLVTYSLFVSFFPLLVAGPIERATHLLPQLKKPRQFDYGKSVDGLKQILWGLFKKMVIADQCAVYADMIFNNSDVYSGSTLFMAAIFFAFQIYGDFSGYSDIALGTARLFGVDLLKNFAYPYFSRDIAEFWRRWHISLSSWFKDYLYIPLGGSRGTTWKKIRNTFVVFLVSGLWHGANWTFIIWGLLNALYIIPSIIGRTNRNNLDIVASERMLPTWSEFLAMIATFASTCFAWIFFRSESVEHAFSIVSKVFSGSLFSLPALFPIKLTLLLTLFMVVEWMGRQGDYALERFGVTLPRAVRWASYYAIVVLILTFGSSGEQFIYFQF
jgi:alginate O-acetyltransferase complex protein AlgI